MNPAARDPTTEGFIPREAVPAVRMVEITKTFGETVVANERISLSVMPGEIHGLLGENGAGKSTLMKILYGLYQPDAGEIFIRGRREFIESPQRAIQLGVGMVHQHFMLVPPLLVVENILLAQQSARGPFLRPREAAEEIARLGETYHLRVDPWARVWQLSVGEQQRVEILNALYHGADILVLDEPTSVLTPQESEELGRAMRLLAESGKTIIFISHKLEEVLQFTHRVTVLRDGRVVQSERTSETSRVDLARMMVGREVLFSLSRPPYRPGEAVCSVRDLSALNDRGLPALKGLTFTVHRGEIFGVAGVDGNGQRELAEVLTGLREKTGGEIVLRGRRMERATPRDYISARVAHIPQKRRGMGLIPEFRLWRNVILKNFDERPISRWGFLRFSSIWSFLRGIVEEFQIRVSARKDLLARQLSGGNQQRLILGREFALDPAFLVASQPTQGLDVGATEYVREKLLERRNRGVGILLISTDLEEILQVSDRIAVLFEGEIMDVVTAEDVDLSYLGMLMAGSQVAPPGSSQKGVPAG